MDPIRFVAHSYRRTQVFHFNPHACFLRGIERRRISLWRKYENLKWLAWLIGNIFFMMMLYVVAVIYSILFLFCDLRIYFWFYSLGWSRIDDLSWIVLNSGEIDESKEKPYSERAKKTMCSIWQSRGPRRKANYIQETL